MTQKTFLIIGAGSFGKHLCQSLAQQGGEVMVVDRCAEKVEALLPFVASGKIGDCTNPEVLRSFGVADFDACFVCIGEDFHNSLVITDILKELGAKYVCSEATQDRQEKFLLHNGADRVIFPEKDIASRLAVKMCNDSVFDYIALTNDYGVFEISVPTAWVGKTLLQLNVRANFGLNVLATRQNNGGVHPILSPDYVCSADEHLLVMAGVVDIRRVAESGGRIKEKKR